VITFRCFAFGPAQSQWQRTIVAFADRLGQIEATVIAMSNGKQSGPRIGMQKGPLTGLGTGLSR
jgi:hypothetical protein